MKNHTTAPIAYSRSMYRPNHHQAAKPAFQLPDMPATISGTGSVKANSPSAT